MSKAEELGCLRSAKVLALENPVTCLAAEHAEVRFVALVPEGARVRLVVGADFCLLRICVHRGSDREVLVELGAVESRV